MKSFHLLKTLINWAQLLRWNKPSGRFILLIPAGWSLWLTPQAPPPGKLVFLMVLGGILISGAGCIANDIWDVHIDRQVERTKKRPLATGKVKLSTAWLLLITTLLLSLFVVLSIPIASRYLCLKLSLIAVVPILIYPSSKRWFKYPQVLLAICWGFSTLIPWAAREATLDVSWTLLSCWAATMIWTFGFDTVYAMADKNDDRKLGINSSALSLGDKVYITISICYALTAIFLAIAAQSAGIGILFWPVWLLFSWGMQREVFLLKKASNETSRTSRHFKNQVLLGSLILFGLVFGRGL